MLDYGVKVSRDGYDVKDVPNTAAKIKQFSLLSGVNLLKIKASAKVSINNSATETIAHGLAYTPIVWVFLKDGSNNLFPVYHNTADTMAHVDATNLIIRNNEGATRDFYYYIFYDQI